LEPGGKLRIVAETEQQSGFGIAEVARRYEISRAARLRFGIDTNIDHIAFAASDPDQTTESRAYMNEFRG
jgi:hypothetical protein